MAVDSFRFLDPITARVMRAWMGRERYESIPWTPMRGPLAAARIAAISSAAIVARGDRPFDRERDCDASIAHGGRRSNRTAAAKRVRAGLPGASERMIAFMGWKPRTRKDRMAQASSQRTLWVCPACGRRFVTRNMWHSCAVHRVDEHFAGGRTRWRPLFDRLVEAAGGDAVEVVAQKTRICFMTSVRFASCRVLASGIVVSFGLPTRAASERFREVVEYGSGWVGHELLLTEPAQIDRELRGWLGTSRRLMGDRERFGYRASE